MKANLDEIVGPVYRDVRGYPHYRVGLDGTVWTRYIKCSNGRGLQMKLTNYWHLVKLAKDTGGYLYVYLWNQVSYRTRVHTLVLETFVGYGLPKEECRHFPDRNRTNNNINNLCWGSRKENRDDQRIHGTLLSGERNHFAKLTQAQVDEIKRRIYNGEVQRLLAQEYNVSDSTISAIKHGTRWT